MTTYMPLLKGKPGEFMAWRFVAAPTMAVIRPLFDVVPTHGETKDLELIVNEATNAWPGGVATIDTGYLDQLADIDGTGDRAIAYLADQLSGRVPYRPVFRVGDPAPVLDDVRRAN